MANGMTRRERELTDTNDIRHILDTAKIVHLGLVDNGEPYVVPMNYGYTLEDGTLTLYLHGAMRGRKIDAMRAHPSVFFSIECDIEPFAGDVACRYGMAYTSLMGNGKAVILEDVEAKKSGLSILMKSQTGEDFTFSDKMVGIVQVIRIDVNTFTAKRREKPSR